MHQRGSGCPKNCIYWPSKWAEYRFESVLPETPLSESTNQEAQVVSAGRKCQEPLNVPLNGLFSRGFSRGKTAQQAIRGHGPLRLESGPLRRGNGPSRLIGLFSGTPPCWNLDRPKRIIKTLRFEHAPQNASGFPTLLSSIVYEWIFGTRVPSTQPKTLSNTEEH